MVIPETSFEVLGVDYMGPFPVTRDEQWYIIVFIDNLTKWVR